MGPLDNPGGVEWPLRGFSKNSTTFQGSTQHCSGLDLWAQGKARTDYLSTETTRSEQARLKQAESASGHTRARAHAPIHLRTLSLTESSAAKNCMGKHFLRCCCTNLCPALH